MSNVSTRYTMLPPALQCTLASATGTLVGHHHSDALAHAAVRGLVPDLGDGAVLDVAGEDGRSWRVIGIHATPQSEHSLRSRLCLVIPDGDAANSGVHAVLAEGRTVLRGELGDGRRERDSFSLLIVPVRGGGRVVAALSLVTFGKHDRYGRHEVTAVEEFAERLGSAIDVVSRHEQTERDALSFRSHLEVAEATIAEMSRTLVAIREENAMLRQLAEVGRSVAVSLDAVAAPATACTSPAYGTRAVPEARLEMERPSNVAVPDVAEASAARPLRRTLRNTPTGPARGVASRTR